MQRQSKVRVERKFGVLFLIHTPIGLSFFDKIAKTKAARVYAEFNTYLMPLITVLAIILFFIGIGGMLLSSEAREQVRGLGPQANLLIPGINPLLPWTYGWIALVITIVIHEGGHGIVARVYNLKIESTGIVLFLIFPVGAFVNIEREELTKASLKQKVAILTAGPLNNMILAAFSLIALYFVISTLSPLPGSNQNFGVVITQVMPGSLAEQLGLSQESVIESIDGQKVNTVNDVGKLLRSSIGDNIEVTWSKKNGDTVSQSGQNENGILGVTIQGGGSPSEILDGYKRAFLDPRMYLLLLTPPTVAQNALPYSDAMAPEYESNLFGSYFPIISNMLFWSWFFNFNVGIFNALPIGPLDGGQLYGSLIENKLKTKERRLNAETLTAAITIIFVLLVLLIIAGPYILE
ncbi:MAG TPA: site-2 protease family protein [Nitrososphaeraceae archaeon]